MVFNKFNYGAEIDLFRPMFAKIHRVFYEVYY